MSDIRKNGQIVQPDVTQMPDDNGWPTPLTDPSAPYKIGVTNGRNGEQTTMDKNKTSQDVWSRPEGKSDATSTDADGMDGQRAGNEKTSQPIWSQPSSGDSGAVQPDIDGDTSVRSSDPLKTSQQSIGDHSTPESDD